VTNIVIAGSRRVPPETAYTALGAFLTSLPSGTVIFMRRGISTAPGPFERAVKDMCDGGKWGMYNHLVRWFVPQISEGLRGRAATFVRDHEMIEADANLVLVFLTPDDLGNPEGGTEHVMASAFLHSIPTYGYLVDGDRITLLGSDDEHDEWKGKVPLA
jgi:hypothetical protein